MKESDVRQEPELILVMGKTEIPVHQEPERLLVVSNKD